MTSILISGGAGFFGKAFTTFALERKLADRICIYSRDEYKQFIMRQYFNDDPRLRFFIGDVRDKDRLRRAMVSVDLVVHAAAIKRIETAAYNPGELCKTNIIGTENVCELAEELKIPCVMLSTDKACEPISAYGYSKALAEQIALNAGAVVTRYGNVANSTGSIIPIWRAMGDVVPVRNPDATRFWMTAQEACELVWDTAMNLSPRIVTPDLPAYRVSDLAEAMGKTMDIVGMSDIEKVHESMRPGHTSENARRMSVDELHQKLEAL